MPKVRSTLSSARAPASPYERPAANMEYRVRESYRSSQWRKGGSNPIDCETGLRRRGAPGTIRKLLPERQLYHDTELGLHSFVGTRHVGSRPWAQAVPALRQSFCLELYGYPGKATLSLNPEDEKEIVLVFVPMARFKEMEKARFVDLTAFCERVVERWTREGLPLGRPAPSALPRPVEDREDEVDLHQINEGFLIGKTNQPVSIIGSMVRNPRLEEMEEERRLERLAARAAKAKAKAAERKAAKAGRTASEGSPSSSPTSTASGQITPASSGEEDMERDAKEDYNFWADAEPEEVEEEAPQPSIPRSAPRMVLSNGPYASVTVHPAMEEYEFRSDDDDDDADEDEAAVEPVASPQPVFAAAPVAATQPTLVDDYTSAARFGPFSFAQQPAALLQDYLSASPVTNAIPSSFFESSTGVAGQYPDQGVVGQSTDQGVLGTLPDPVAEFLRSVSADRSPDTSGVVTAEELNALIRDLDDGNQWLQFVEPSAGGTATATAAEGSSPAAVAAVNTISESNDVVEPGYKPFLTSASSSSGAADSLTAPAASLPSYAPPPASPTKSDWSINLDNWY